jgi:hypothetical protein
MTDAIDGIAASGGADLYHALARALEPAQPPGGRSHVVVISDGAARIDTWGLDRLIRPAASSGTTVSAVCVGDDCDEGWMRSLAEAGGGHFYWTRRGPELDQRLSREILAAQTFAATSVRLSHTCGIQIVDAGESAVGPEGEVDLGPLRAGERRSTWLTLDVEQGHCGGEAVLFDPNLWGSTFRSVGFDSWLSHSLKLTQSTLVGKPRAMTASVDLIQTDRTDPQVSISPFTPCPQ